MESYLISLLLFHLAGAADRALSPTGRQRYWREIRADCARGTWGPRCVALWRAMEGRKTLSATDHLAGRNASGSQTDVECPTHLPILLSPLHMGQTTAACVSSETSLHIVPQSKSSSLLSDLLLSFHSHGIISIKLFSLLTVWSLSFICRLTGALWILHWLTQKSRAQGNLSV